VTTAPKILWPVLLGLREILRSSSYNSWTVEIAGVKKN